MLSDPLDSRMIYLRDLFVAGVRGLRAVPPPGSMPLSRAALGAATGSLGTLLVRGRSKSSIAIGSLIGLGAAIGWNYRKSAAGGLHGAMQQVQMVRDARWLAANPIDYA